MDHGAMLAFLEQHRAEVLTGPDYDNEVAREVVRCRWEGTRAVAVAASTKPRQQVTALLDLLELHAHDPHGLHDGQWVAKNEVTVLLLDPRQGEAVHALRTLRSQASTRVRLLQEQPDGSLGEAAAGPSDVHDPKAAGWSRWPDQLLHADRLPPTTELPEGTQLRPVLGQDAWSVQLQGVEVGRLTGDEGGWVEVDPASGPMRKLWPHGRLDWAQGQPQLEAFIRAWGAEGRPTPAQLERAFTAQVLPAAYPVPVKWSPGGPAHLADGVDATTVYVTAKAQGSGTGQRYRHAVADAVLARHFLRGAAALAPWFPGHAAAAATVLIAPPDYHQRQWVWRTQRLGDLFGVEVYPA